MNSSRELSELYGRDLKRLLQEVRAFPNSEILWQTLPGVTNSAGNLIIHLEGNLREYIGRQLGGVDYRRERDLEFTSSGLTIDDLNRRLTEVSELVPNVISALSQEQLEADYPEKIRGEPLSTRQFLVHLYGHLNYHLGQINYLRRILTR